MRVDDRRQRRGVPREPLRQEEVPRRPVHVGHRRVAELVEAVVPVEPRSALPPRESPLRGPRRKATSLRRNEQRSVRLERLTEATLPRKESSQLRDEPRRKEHLALSAPLRRGGVENHPMTHLAAVRGDVAHVEPEAIPKPQPRPE